MREWLGMIGLIILVFQLLYNFVVAGTAKYENDGFLFNGILCTICFVIVFLEVYV